MIRPNSRGNQLDDEPETIAADLRALLAGA
jgi:hypothetical protein